MQKVDSNVSLQYWRRNISSIRHKIAYRKNIRKAELKLHRIVSEERVLLCVDQLISNPVVRLTKLKPSSCCFSRHILSDSESSISYPRSYTPPIQDRDSENNSTPTKSNDPCPELVAEEVGAPLNLRLKLNIKDNQWFVKVPEKPKKQVDSPRITSDEASESDGPESLNKAINDTIKHRALREISSNSREESTEQLLADIDVLVRDDSVTSSGIVEESSDMTTRIGTSKSPRISRVPVSVTGEELVIVNKEALSRTINSFKKTAERKRHVHKKPNKLVQMRKEFSQQKPVSSECENSSPILIESSPEESRRKSCSPLKHGTWSDLPSTSSAAINANEFSIEGRWESRHKNRHEYSSSLNNRRSEKNRENITPNKIRDCRGRSLESPMPETKTYSRESSNYRRRSGDDSRERYGKRSRSRSPPRSRKYEASSSGHNFPSSSSEDSRYSRESSRYKVRRRDFEDDNKDSHYRSRSRTPDRHRHYRRESRHSSVLSSEESKAAETSESSRKHKRKQEKDSRSESHSKHKKRKEYVIPKLSSSADVARAKSVDSGHSSSSLDKRLKIMNKLFDRVDPNEHLENEQIVAHRKHKRDRYSVDSGIGSEPVSSEAPEVSGNVEKKSKEFDVSNIPVESNSKIMDLVNKVITDEALLINIFGKEIFQTLKTTINSALNNDPQKSQSPSLDEIDQMLDKAYEDSNAMRKLSDNLSQTMSKENSENDSAVSKETSATDATVQLSTSLSSTSVEVEDSNITQNSSNATSVILTKESMKSIQAKVNSPKPEDANPPKSKFTLETLTNIDIENSTFEILKNIKIKNQTIEQMHHIQKNVVNMLSTEDYSSDDDDSGKPKKRTSKKDAAKNENNEKLKSIEAVDNASNVIRSLRDKAVKERRLNASTKDSFTNKSPSASSQNLQTEKLTNVALTEKEKLLSLKEPVDFQYSSEDFDKFLNQISDTTANPEKSVSRATNKPESQSQIRVFTSKELGSTWENCPTPAPAPIQQKSRNESSAQSVIVRKGPNPTVTVSESSTKPTTPCVSLCTIQIGIVNGNPPTGGTSQIQSAPASISIVPTHSLSTTTNIQNSLGQSVNVLPKQISDIAPIIPTTIVNTEKTIPQMINQPLVSEQRSSPTSSLPNPRNVFTNVATSTPSLPIFNPATTYNSMPTSVQQPVLEQELLLRSAAYSQAGVTSSSIQKIQAQVQQMHSGGFVQTQMTVNSSSAPSTMYSAVAPNFNSAAVPNSRPSVLASLLLSNPVQAPTISTTSYTPPPRPPPPYPSTSLKPAYATVNRSSQEIRCTQPNCIQCKFIENYYFNQSTLQNIYEITKLLRIQCAKFHAGCQDRREHQKYRQYIYRFFGNMSKLHQSLHEPTDFFEFVSRKSVYTLNPELTSEEARAYRKTHDCYERQRAQKIALESAKATYNQNPNNYNAATSGAVSYTTNMTPQRQYNYPAGFSQTSSVPTPVPPPRHSTMPNCPPHIQPVPAPTVPATSYVSPSVPLVPNLSIPSVSMSAPSNENSKQQKIMSEQQKKQLSDQVRVYAALKKRTQKCLEKQQQHQLDNANSTAPRDPRLKPSILKRRKSRSDSTQPEQLPLINQSTVQAAPQIPAVEPVVRTEEPSIQNESQPVNSTPLEVQQSSTTQAVQPALHKEQNKDQAQGRAINFNEAIDALKNMPQNYGEARVLRRSPRKSGSIPANTQNSMPPEQTASVESSNIESQSKLPTPTASLAREAQVNESTLEESPDTTTENTSTEAESNEDQVNSQSTLPETSPSVGLDENNQLETQINPFSWDIPFIIKRESDSEQTNAENLHHDAEEQTFTFSLDNIDENKYYNEEDDDNDIFIDFESIIDIKQEPQESQEAQEEKFADQLKKDTVNIENLGTTVESASEGTNEVGAVEATAVDAVDIKEETSEDGAPKDNKESTRAHEISIVTLDSDDDDDEVDNKNNIFFKNSSAPLVVIKNELIYPDDNMDLGFLNDLESPQKTWNAKLNEKSSKVDGKGAKLEGKAAKLNEKSYNTDESKGSTSSIPKSKDSAPANSSNLEEIIPSSSKKPKDNQKQNSKSPPKTSEPEMIILDDDDEDENLDDVDKSSTISSDRETVKLNSTNEDLMIEDENIVSESYKYDKYCIDEEIECLKISEGLCGASMENTAHQPSSSSEPEPLDADDEIAQIKPLDSDGDIFDVTDIKVESANSSFSYRI